MMWLTRKLAEFLFPKLLGIYLPPVGILSLKIEDPPEIMVFGANCGICGKWMPDELVPKYWTWSICAKCGEVDEQKNREN